MFDELNATYNKYKIDYPFSQIVWDLSKVSSELDAVTSVHGQYMGNICYGQIEDVEAYVAQFRSDLRKAGIEKLINEFQRQLDDFYSSSSKK